MSIETYEIERKWVSAPRRKLTVCADCMLFNREEIECDVDV